MTGEITPTVIGNLTANPELRFTTAGAAVANFTIASTPRTYDRQTNAWKDGETVFLRCSAWREQAENLAKSFHKGNRVIATGKLVSHSYTTKEGEKRTTLELEVEEIAASVRYTPVTIPARTQTEPSTPEVTDAPQW